MSPTQSVKVRLDAGFILRSPFGDWREDEELQALLTVIHGMFESVSVTVSGEFMGDCSCDSGEPWAGDFGTTDPACPWHGEDAA